MHQEILGDALAQPQSNPFKQLSIIREGPELFLEQLEKYDQGGRVPASDLLKIDQVPICSLSFSLFHVLVDFIRNDKHMLCWTPD